MNPLQEPFYHPILVPPPPPISAAEVRVTDPSHTFDYGNHLQVNRKGMFQQSKILRGQLMSERLAANRTLTAPPNEFMKKKCN